MFDIAAKRGVKIRHRAPRGRARRPGGHLVAVRRGGTEELLKLLDELAPGCANAAVASTWQAPDSAGLRAAQRQADAIIRSTVHMQPPIR